MLIIYVYASLIKPKRHTSRPDHKVIKLFPCSNSTEHKISTAHKNLKKTTNKAVSCFKSLSSCIYHAYKC